AAPAIVRRARPTCCPPPRWSTVAVARNMPPGLAAFTTLPCAVASPCPDAIGAMCSVPTHTQRRYNQAAPGRSTARLGPCCERQEGIRACPCACQETASRMCIQLSTPPSDLRAPRRLLLVEARLVPS